MSERTEMGHAGHFICGHLCQFRLNTYVNGYIVSTVGELKFIGDSDSIAFRPMGASPHLYETMVFPAVKVEGVAAECCPWAQASGDSLDSRRWMTPGEATKGHNDFVAKYAIIQADP